MFIFIIIIIRHANTYVYVSISVRRMIGARTFVLLMCLVHCTPNFFPPFLQRWKKIFVCVKGLRLKLFVFAKTGRLKDIDIVCPALRMKNYNLARSPNSDGSMDATPAFFPRPPRVNELTLLPWRFRVSRVSRCVRDA